MRARDDIMHRSDEKKVRTASLVFTVGKKEGGSVKIRRRVRYEVYRRELARARLVNPLAEKRLAFALLCIHYTLLVMLLSFVPIYTPTLSAIIFGFYSPFGLPDL